MFNNAKLLKQSLFGVTKLQNIVLKMQNICPKIAIIGKCFGF